jgi:hypothetical protein
MDARRKAKKAADAQAAKKKAADARAVYKAWKRDQDAAKKRAQMRADNKKKKK